MGHRSQYPLEVRREAVRLVLSTDESMLSVAKDLVISEKTLGDWVRTEKAGSAREACHSLPRRPFNPSRRHP